jgi:hypothetical protein
MLKLKNLKIMQTDLIIINDYCTRCDIEQDFVRMLGEGGLIDVEMIDDTDCFPASQLGELERYTHLYYDLSINIEGIDAIRHLLRRIENLQERVRKLENELHFYR